MKKIMLFIAALFLCGTMHAQNYHYTYNYHQWDNVCTVIAVVNLNGEPVASSDYELGAFVDGEVRGTEFLLELDPTYPGTYFAYVGISFTNANETVTFKLYDHVSGAEYDNCTSSTAILTNLNGYGENADPVILDFTYEAPEPFGPQYPWTDHGNLYPDKMYLETQIQINGVPVETEDWIVGAFCGDECRGIGEFWTSAVQSLICEIVVGGQTGDVINFYLYDVVNEEVFRAVCNVTLNWINGDLGDMFEPLVLNFLTEQSFIKPILAYSTEQNVNNHYYLIASPIGEVSPEDVTHMLENSYDLYYFDQNQNLEWINYEGDNGNYNLMPGKGYLYANSQNVDLTFTGFPYVGNGEVTLTKNDNADLPGWNLVGNPFSVDAYIGNRQFYVMNGDGTDLEVANRTKIDAMEGIFVEAQSNNETLTFTTEPQSKGAALEMNVIRDRGTVIDRAIVNFGQQSTLTKFMINRDNTHISLPQDNTEYAAISAESEMGEIPVSFKAAANGNYSLCFSAEEVSFSYLHLIDNLTGADTDLLSNPSYSFNALTTDYANRFKLVFATGNATDDGFTFFSNGSWIINNEGRALLQVVDVTGRIMKSEQIDGCYSLNLQAAPGVYMFRLINGDNMRVQKVVVK